MRLIPYVRLCTSSIHAVRSPILRTFANVIEIYRTIFFCTLLGNLFCALSERNLESTYLRETPKKQIIHTFDKKPLTYMSMHLHSSPESNVLLDTDKSGWGDWLTNTGKYDGWRLQTHPLLQRKVYGVCQVLRNQNDNWLHSPLFESSEAVSVSVGVTFTMRSCLEHPDPKAINYCKESLDLLLYQADQPLNSNPRGNNSLFTNIAKLTRERVYPPKPLIDVPVDGGKNLEEQVSTYLAKVEVKGMYMTLAIRDQGSCSTIRRVVVSYFACPKLITDFMEYPRTVSGLPGQARPVVGHCTEGAIPTLKGELPELLCLNDGTWSRPLVQTNFSEAFPTAEDVRLNYKCVCSSGYGVAEDDPSGVLYCRALPSKPLDLSVNTSDPARIRLSWRSPRESGGRLNLWFVIQCMDSLDLPCTNQRTFVSPNPTVLTSVILIGLSLGQTYAISVIATNELSELFSSLLLQNSTAAVRFNLPDPVTVLVSNINIQDVTLARMNNSEESGKFINYGVEPKKSGNIVRISWDPPEHRPTVLSSVKEYPLSVWTSVVEYQVYVWVSAKQETPRLTSDGKTPTLIHFLSETSIDLTDLPEAGTIEIWVRPRLRQGWGVYSKSIFQQPFTKIRTKTPEKIMPSRLMADGHGMYFEQPGTTTIKDMTLPVQRMFNWRTVILSILGLLAILLLIGFIILLKLKRITQVFASYRNRSVRSTAQKEFARTQQAQNESKTATSFQLQETFQDNDSQSDIKRFAILLELGGHNGTSIRRPVFTEQGRNLVYYLAYMGQNVRAAAEVGAPFIETPDWSSPAPGNHTEDGEMEIDKSRVHIEKTIGEGEFAEVCAGKLDGDKVVAVKMLRCGVSEKTQQDFLKEATTMKQMKHPNIVRFIGMITLSEPHMIIMEFMDKGSLDRYLQSIDEELPFTRLVQMLCDVCAGMKYISEKGYVHRDLAARNVLVGKNVQCKISDFGMARKVGENVVEDAYTLTGGKVPIRWISPEAIMYRRFTIASDIWSFGIVAWEIFSYGQRPYWDWTNQAVISALEKGYRLPAPESCPPSVYTLMTDCWSVNPSKRPEFPALEKRLLPLLSAERQSTPNAQLQPDQGIEKYLKESPNTNSSGIRAQLCNLRKSSQASDCNGGQSIPVVAGMNHRRYRQQVGRLSAVLENSPKNSYSNSELPLVIENYQPDEVPLVPSDRYTNMHWVKGKTRSPNSFIIPNNARFPM
ncbi:unnamed protein product [Calicophoron daubneyi]|uniref:receptor protein-tyrosine kinase n=1 Tax=Calicophoron daubneyi TaxID=300641 RepID=A0AAV2T3S2_CALDB